MSVEAVAINIIAAGIRKYLSSGEELSEEQKQEIQKIIESYYEKGETETLEIPEDTKVASDRKTCTHFDHQEVAMKPKGGGATAAGFGGDLQTGDLMVYCKKCEEVWKID